MTSRERSVRRAAIAIAVVVLSWGPPAVAADDPAATPAAGPPAPSPSVQQEIVSVQAFGDRNPDCLSWTDACVICARGLEGKPPNCSTPGIACLPGPITCTAERPKK